MTTRSQLRTRWAPEPPERGIRLRVVADWSGTEQGDLGPWPARFPRGGGDLRRAGADNFRMTENSGCFSCAAGWRPGLPPREQVYLDRYWRVAHAFGTAQPGWLVVLHQIGRAHV